MGKLTNNIVVYKVRDGKLYATIVRPPLSKWRVLLATLAADLPQMLYAGGILLLCVLLGFM